MRRMVSCSWKLKNTESLSKILSFTRLKISRSVRTTEKWGSICGMDQGSGIEIGTSSLKIWGLYLRKSFENLGFCKKSWEFGGLFLKVKQRKSSGRGEGSYSGLHILLCGLRLSDEIGSPPRRRGPFYLTSRHAPPPACVTLVVSVVPTNLGPKIWEVM